MADSRIEDLLHMAIEGGNEDLRELARELVRQGYAGPVSLLPRYGEAVKDSRLLERRLLYELGTRFGLNSILVRAWPTHAVEEVVLYQMKYHKVSGSVVEEELVKFQSSDPSVLWDRVLQWAMSQGHVFEAGR